MTSRVESNIVVLLPVAEVEPSMDLNPSIELDGIARKIRERKATKADDAERLRLDQPGHATADCAGNCLEEDDVEMVDSSSYPVPLQLAPEETCVFKQWCGNGTIWPIFMEKQVAPKDMDTGVDAVLQAACRAVGGSGWTDHAHFIGGDLWNTKKSSGMDSPFIL
eukprot:scaffold22513_cov57-Attheya_sp.AAC.6